MAGILSIDVPLGFAVAVAVAVILGVILALLFVFDLWSEVRELLDELREWRRDRRD